MRVFEIVKAVRRFGVSYMGRMSGTYQRAWKEMYQGYLATHSLFALLNVGLLDELQQKGSVNVGSFAADRALDLHVLRPVCEALFCIGVLDREGDIYRIGRKYKPILEVMRGWLEVSWGYEEVIQSLEAMMRKERVYARDFYRKSDFVARGSGDMEKWFYFPMAYDIILTRGYGNVLDLGCGDGTFLRQLCALNPAVNGYGIDLAAAAVEEGRQKAKEAGLEGRLQLFALDISKVDHAFGPLKSVDAATVFFVLHELMYIGQDVTLNFLKDFRRVFPGVPLLVFEVIRPTAEEMRRRKGMAIYYCLYHDLTQQKLADRKTWNELFRAAGFRSIKERQLPFVRSAIYMLQ